MIANNLSASADRLEHYTESVRNISNLEALEIQRRPCMLSEFLETVTADMRILADKSNIELNLSKDVPDDEYRLDTESYSRVLENLLQNALRFANKTVYLSWTVENKKLLTTVADDGPGFALEVLKRKKHTVLSVDAEHIGMGLTVSKILCEKHGGTLKLYNSEDGGAFAQFTFDIR